MVRDVATREIAPRALELDEKSLFPEYARDLFAKLGLLNPLLPAAYGGTELKERYLRRFAGESTLLTALAATEPAAGSDLLAMKTRAVRQGDKYVINGQKCFITNGSVADVIVVYAYTDPEKGSKGISAFVVEK